MRLRITRRLSGSIDGLELSQFESGKSYDVGTSIGSYLLAVGAAEPVPDDQPAGGVSRPRVERAESRRFSSAISRLTSAADSAFRSAVARDAPGRAENSKA